MLKEKIQEIDGNLETYSTNYYVGFKYADNWRVIFTIKARSGRLEIELTRAEPKDFKDPKSMVEYMKKSKKHYNQHISHFYIKSESELDYAVGILKQQITRFKEKYG